MTCGHTLIKTCTLLYTAERNRRQKSIDAGLLTITDSVLSIRAKKGSRNHITETSQYSTSRGVVEW